MLNEKIKSLRKQRGFTQEDLAIRLNVVRQTISKWEKGLSVPDAQMLIQIADLFEVSTSELLGENIQLSETATEQQNEIAQQLSRINEQLALKNKRSNTIWKVILGIFIAFVVLHIFFLISTIIVFNSFDTNTHSTYVNFETSEPYELDEDSTFIE
ncbi:MAG: hypothetical protein ATN35_05045 [Epulopiscium sp. Nele67-Bin004]|nr:MAG: hypothetical protein ATN35_05045 [Epulopiscium sp. Nele67-Bin004]